MPFNVSQRLSLDVTTVHIIEGSKAGLLSAFTKAKARGVWFRNILGSLGLESPGSMPRKIAYGLSGNLSTVSTAYGSDTGFIPTSALAVTVRYSFDNALLTGCSRLRHYSARGLSCASDYTVLAVS